MTPAVSVIVPIYNAERYLSECLDSLLEQTLSDIEIICVNDGSTDGTEQILKEYARRDSRIIVVDKANHGYGSALNDGLSIASGEFVGIVEPDDFVDRAMYENLMTIVRASTDQLDFVKCGWFEYSDEKGIIKKEDPYQGIAEGTPFCVRDYKSVLRKHPSTPMGIYRKQFLDENGISYVEAPGAGWVDNPFFLQTMYFSNKIAATHEAYYYYRTIQNDNSSALRDCTVPFLRLTEMFDFLASVDSDDVIFEALCKRVFSYLREVLNSRYYEEQAATVRPLIASVLARVPAELLDGDAFTDWDRKNYSLFRGNRKSVEPCVSPRVSIVVPFQNAERTMGECLDSLLRQRMEEIEILCVEYNSGDYTRCLIRERSEIDSRVKVICCSSAHTFGGAANVGLDAASGPYVAIIDPSGLVDAAAFEVLYSKAEQDCLDICKTDYYSFRTDSAGRKHAAHIEICPVSDLYHTVFTPIDRQDALSWVSILNAGSGIYRRGFLNDNDIRFNEIVGSLFPEDGFSLKCLFSAKRFECCRMRLFWCRSKDVRNGCLNTEKAFAVFFEYSATEAWLKRSLERWSDCKEEFLRIASRRYIAEIDHVEKDEARKYIAFLSRQLDALISSEHLALTRCPDDLRKQILWLVSAPDAYFNQRFVYPQTIDSLEKRLAKAEKKNLDYQNSNSWKIGRAVTLLPRKLSGVSKKNELKPVEQEHHESGDLRVLFIAGDAKYSGATLSLVTLADGLRARGEDVFVVLNCRGPIEEKLQQIGLPYEVIRSATWACFEDTSPEEREKQGRAAKKVNHEARKRLEELVVERDINLIHSNTLGISVGAEVARDKGIKHIWHLREFVQEDHHLDFIDRDAALELISASDKLLCVSKAVFEKYSSLFGVEKCEVVYNGIDPMNYLVLNRVLFCDSFVRLTVAGRICEGKGQEDAVRALSIVAKNCSDKLQLRLVGETVHSDYVGMIKRLIRKLGLEMEVSIMGSRKDMDQIWAETDIALVTSRKEAFGRCAVEAMMAGALVIGARSGGTAEIVSEGCGYLYEPGNPDDLAKKIEYALKHKDEASRCAKSGQVMALERFSNRNNEDAIWNIHNAII